MLVDERSAMAVAFEQALLLYPLWPLRARLNKRGDATMKLIEGQSIERADVVYHGDMRNPHTHRTVVVLTFSNGVEVGLDIDGLIDEHPQCSITLLKQ